jgi:hypothetical protein
MDPRRKGARIFKNFMISVSDTSGDDLFPVTESFDHLFLEPVIDRAREIPFESLNTLSVCLVSSFL